MGVVDDPIELTATPAHVQLQFGLELSEDSAERLQGQLIDSASFHARDRLLADASSVRQIDLSPAATPPERSDDATDPDRMHRDRVPLGPHLAIGGGGRTRTCGTKVT